MNTVVTDVLVIGTGPAGAATALCLARAGVKVLAVSKYHATSPDPRAHITNQRTMEFLRDFGLEETAKKIAMPWEDMGEHVFGMSLAGEEFGRIPAWASSAIAQGEHMAASPSRYCDLPQLHLEPLLVSQAGLLGADMRFKTEYLSHTQDEDGVTATLLDRVSGSQYQVRAQYLVGADGGRSKVAADIGLEFDGAMGLGETGNINIEIQADLSQYCAHRRSDMYWMLQAGENLMGLPKGPGIAVLRMVRPMDRWVCVVGYELAKGLPSLAHADLLPLVHRTIGSDQVPVEILSVSTWTTNRQYALTNTKGRVFCIGDAVHRHTPFGGLGSNTCIQDAYNLSWKLAMVIQGQAGTRLLNTYQDERAPIGKQITEHAFNGGASMGPLLMALGVPPGGSQEAMDQAIARLKEPTAEGAERRAKLRQAMDGTLNGFGRAHGMELNQRYTSSAIASDGTPDPGFARDPVQYYQASSRPGAHLPHAWVTRRQRKVSTFDLCGQGRFTLLTGLSGSAWKAAAERAAQELGIALVVHVIGFGQEVVDSHGEYARISEVEESGALLVRPDMMVAWRAHHASAELLGQLPAVLRQLLGR
ncbi:MAG: FAD-dependent monooxygenase [Alicycliphilus sp.]|nr:FAD-dependent monooxygenase [Alicycliphilus sp.]